MIKNKILIKNDIVQEKSQDKNVAEDSAVQFCDSLLIDAIARGASDIHIEPFAKTVIVRFRIDGKLRKIDEISPQVYPAILARYKIARR